MKAAQGGFRKCWQLWTKGERGVRQMVTITDKGEGGGVYNVLTIADKGGKGWSHILLTITDKWGRGGWRNFQTVPRPFKVKREATLLLNWTSKTNPWTQTLLFKLNVPYFGSIGFEGIFGFVCPGCPKSTAKYLLCTKGVRKHGVRCFTAMCTFWMQCLVEPKMPPK